MTVAPPIPVPIAEIAAEPGGALGVGRNFSFRLGSQVISALINVAGMVLLGNALSAGGYGEYAFYYALIPLIASLGDAGVGIIITREIARDRSCGPRLLGDAIVIRAAVSGLILLGALATAWGVLDPGPAALISIVTATALMDFSQDTSVWVFRAHERLDLEALLLLLSQVVWLAALAAGVWLKAQLSVLLAAAALGFAARLGVGAWIVSRKLYRPQFRPEVARLRRLLAQGLPFGAAVFGVVLYGRVGLLMLKALATPSDVGYFQVAYMLSQPLGFISSALGIALFPAISRRALRGDDSVRRALRRAFKCQLLVALPLTIGLVLLAQPIISLLFRGHGFGPAAVALRLTSAGLIVIFLNLMARYVLAALDRQGHYLRAVVVGLAANAALCAALVPGHGFVGACVAYLAAEAAIGIVCLRALSRYVRVAELVAEAARPLLAAAGMGLLLFAFRGGNVVLLAAAGSLAYLALLRLLGALSDEEMRLFRGVCVSFGLPRPAVARGAEQPS